MPARRVSMRKIKEVLRLKHEAVLAPWQFSAFNRNSPKRRHYTGLDETPKAAG